MWKQEKTSNVKINKTVINSILLLVYIWRTVEYLRAFKHFLNSSVCLPFILIYDVHGRVLNVVEVEADNGDIDSAWRDSLWHLPGSSISGFGIIDFGILDVLILPALKNSHALVKGHPDFGLVKSTSCTRDTNGLVWKKIKIYCLYLN